MFEDELKEQQGKLLAHPIYESVRTVRHLRKFMQAHVFAVWDFMSLAKRLQVSLTCTQIPWVPPVNRSSARFINEIILNEETDTDPEGKALSHLDLYLQAMREVGASTDQFEKFLGFVTQGLGLKESLRRAEVVEYIARFVGFNVNLAKQGSIEEVASCFLFGREDSIPKMFRSFLGNWGVSRTDAPGMIYYLERHITLDGDEHGPAALAILKSLIENDGSRRARALRSAQEAIMLRIALWDGILGEVRSGDNGPEQALIEPAFMHPGR